MNRTSSNWNEKEETKGFRENKRWKGERGKKDEGKAWELDGEKDEEQAFQGRVWDFRG